MKMKRYILAVGLAAIIAVAVLAQAGIGIKSIGYGDDGNGNHEKWKRMVYRHEKMEHMKMMRARNMARIVHRNLLSMDREEGALYYSNGIFYVDDTPLYVGDTWWLNHTIRSDYDGDGNYETVWNELNGLIGSHVVVNGIYKNGTLVASHINGMFLRIPIMATFITINGTLEKINGSYFVDGYHIIIPNRIARSDYDGDGVLERMRVEMDGLVGQEVKIDGYILNENIKPLHINGIAI